MGWRSTFTRAVAGVAGIAAITLGGSWVAHGRTGGRASAGRPQRPDIVALFTSGAIVFDANGTIGSTSLKSGRVSLSTDEPYCVPSPSKPCHYTINQIELRANDFTLKGTSVESATVPTA